MRPRGPRQGPLGPDEQQSFKSLDALGAVTGERVSSRAICALLALLFLLTPATAAIGGEPEEGEASPTAALQGATGNPVRTPYYVKCQSGNNVLTGDLSPLVLNETTMEAAISVGGPTFPRYTLAIVGRFTMTVQSPMEVMKVDKAVVWAQGREPTQGAHFRIFFTRNSNTIDDMSSANMDLDTAPKEFEMQNPPTFNTPERFAQGETLGIEIQYSARSRWYFGPAPDCIVLANSLIHATRIELTTRPVELNVTQPSVSNDEVHFSTQVLDSAGISPEKGLVVTTTIIPNTGATGNFRPSHLKIMSVSEGMVNGYQGFIINYTWFWKRSKATDGMFEFFVDASYGVPGINYTNTTFFELKFPQPPIQKPLLSKQSAIYLGTIIAVAVGGIAVFMFWRSRTGSSYPYRRPGGRLQRGWRPGARRAPREWPPPRMPSGMRRTPSGAMGPPPMQRAPVPQGPSARPGATAAVMAPRTASRPMQPQGRPPRPEGTPPKRRLLGRREGRPPPRGMPRGGRPPMGRPPEGRAPPPMRPDGARARPPPGAQAPGARRPLRR